MMRMAPFTHPGYPHNPGTGTLLLLWANDFDNHDVATDAGERVVQ
jgi:hypothetical protein